MPKLQMLVSSRNEECLLLTESDAKDRLRKFVLTYFCLIHPIPDKHAAIISIAKGYEEIIFGCKDDSLDSKLVTLEELDGSVRHCLSHTECRIGLTR